MKSIIIRITLFSVFLFCLSSFPAYPAASSYFDTVQKTYIGYYQRAADPGGLIYWAGRLDSVGGNFAEMIEAFAYSAEAQTLYGTINSDNISTVVNGIYNSLFGRDAEAEGLNYYVNGFNLGQFTPATIMLNVLYGAQNEDLQSVNNKLVAANLFTRTIDPDLDGSNFQVTYAGDPDAIAGRNFLSLYASSVKVPTQVETTAYIKANIADPGDPILGQTPPSEATSAQGFWNGSTSSNRLLSGVVLDDGTYYVMYSPSGNSSLIAGFIQGNGTSSNGSFSSGNAMDVNFQGLGVLTGDVSATYTEKQFFTGKITYDNGTSSTFSSAYSANYDNVPLLSELAGTFVGQAVAATGWENGTFSISANGALSGIGSFGCMATGTVTPRSHGNVFNMSVTFGGPPCKNQNLTITGIAFYDSSTRRIYAAAPLESRTDGFLFVGVKP